MNSVYLNSIGVVSEGIDNWPTCRDILTGTIRYQHQPIPKFNSKALPVNERRRITATIRLALQAATEAIENGTLSAQHASTVFATSNGDLELSARICNALTMPERPVSPTDFHNSVHNAPSGYWSIGSQCNMPSTSLSAGNASFSAGLVEAITQVLNKSHPVLLVAYDQQPPDIFANNETANTAFSAALILTKEKTDNSLAELKIQVTEQYATTNLNIKLLEDIRSRNPMAQALLLFDLVARQSIDQCLLPYHGRSCLLVEHHPC